MKTSTLLLIGGAVAVGYYLSKRQADATATGTATGAVARTAVPNATQVVIVSPEDDDYGPSWGWASPVWGGRAWRGGGGGGGHGHGHGGHGHRGRH